ncbi:hypothetical protein [Anaerocolumna sp. MB42-C2]|uniref:hypothetical protein n=1 Tax=Anaerocolumna sp. MB42-C2 TaxID=3070997 RepID=UPI0027DF648F|nr:hypothetical protein [Anaerocolumna sp. MB42-C2]WMJ85518.1 hypothetical protein RBU59_15715 [Anaerocolumna sp. MB42-C2]
MESNILSGGLEDINKLKDTLTELNDYIDRNDALAAEESRLEKTIKNKEKAITEEIAGTTKKRKDEIEATYDDQLEKTRLRAKKIRNKKEKSKSVKISERIEAETAQLKEEYRQMVLETKAVLKQKKVPAFCNTKLFYSLFLPTGMGDLAVIILSLIIILLIIPCFFYFYVIPDEKMIYLILIYFITVIFFGGAYMLIDNNVKDKHMQTIKRIYSIRVQISDNKKKREKIRKRILKDKDESQYGLDNFDQELSELDNELKFIMDQKKEALNTFENNTRYVISDEIKARSQEELNTLKKEYGEVYVKIKDTEEKIKVLSMEIANKYEAYLGKEFMSVEKLNILSDIIMENDLKTISEALGYYKEGNY